MGTKVFSATVAAGVYLFAGVLACLVCILAT